MGVSRTKTILSGITGKVGSVVLTKMRGVEVVKEKPRPPKKGSQSEKQDVQRARFSCANTFLTNIGSDVPMLGYQLRKNAGMTKLNAAMKHLMGDTLKGDYPDFSINFSKVQLSSPVNEIDASWKGKCVAGAGFQIDVTWELNPYPGKETRLHDWAVIVLYDETREENLYKKMESRAIVPRNALKWKFAGFAGLVGHPIHCWIFFVSADKKRVSKSEYLGSVTMIA